MVDGITYAFGLLFQWPNLPIVIAGILFGMLIGFLPGMAGSVALALLIPLSFTMPPDVAILFLIGAYSPAGFGGMLTSILVNTPGDPENAATTLDGYPMAQQGRAGAAIGAATAASVIGGLFGTVVLISLIPLAERSVLAFSYPEYLMLAALGLTVIAVTMEGTAVKGLLAAGVGFMIAFIGLDPITGSPRFTFDQIYLWDGIDIIPVLIGLFAGSEILALYGRGVSVTDSAKLAKKYTGPADIYRRPVTFWQGVASTFRHWFLVVRSSVLGTVTGVIPGVGGSVSGFLAYSHAKQTSKHPEDFGHGAVEGVIAAESANDAKAGGSMLPTVAFGIPGTVGMAILLGALIMHGLPVGPSLILDHPEIVYVLIVGMTVSKFVAPFVVWAIAKQATNLTKVRPGLFTPIIAVAALVGTYTVRMNHMDVIVALVFAYVGYAMRRYGFSRIAFIIALVLGEMFERTYQQTVRTFGSVVSVIERPIAGTLMVLCVLVLAFAAVRGVRAFRTATPSLDDDEEELPQSSVTFQPGRVVFTFVLLAFTAVLVGEAAKLPTDAADMPLLIGIPLLIGLSVLFLLSLRPLLRLRHRKGESPPVSLPGAGPADPRTSTGGGVVQEQRTEVQPYTERQVLQRQAAFGLWCLGFAVLAAVTSYAVAIPIAMVFFLIVLAKEDWKTTLYVTVGTWVVVFGLFDLAVGVNLR